MQVLPIRTQTFEFVASSLSTGDPITRGQLRKLLVFSTTATNAYPIFDTARLVRVEHWSNPTSSGVFTKIEHEYLGAGAPARVFSASGVPALPARLTTTPPPQSFARLWGAAANDADPLINIVFASGDVIRFTIQYTLTNVIQTALTGAGGSAAGLLLFNNIDTKLVSKETNAATTAFV